MSPRQDSTSDNPYSNRKARDRAFVLLIVGLTLFLPPSAGVFQLDIRIAGIPFTALYLFVAWGLLIAGAAALSTRLKDDAPLTDEPESTAGTED